MLNSIVKVGKWRSSITGYCCTLAAQFSVQLLKLNYLRRVELDNLKKKLKHFYIEKVHLHKLFIQIIYDTYPPKSSTGCAPSLLQLYGITT